MNDGPNELEGLRGDEEVDEQPWWNQYEVENPQPEVAVGQDIAEEFEGILRWIENEMELEISENCQYIVYSSSPDTHFLL